MHDVAVCQMEPSTSQLLQQSLYCPHITKADPARDTARASNTKPKDIHGPMAWPAKYICYVSISLQVVSVITFLRFKLGRGGTGGFPVFFVGPSPGLCTWPSPQGLYNVVLI